MRALIVDDSSMQRLLMKRALEAMGFEVLATLPEAFRHPQLGYVGLHVMYRVL